jgi:hypothetical protein
MLGGAIFRELLVALRALELPTEAENDLVAVLEAGRVALPFLNEAAMEPVGDRSVFLRRAAGIYAGFCAGNLADDLIDGDATYLADPARLGPSLQFTLQHLGTAIVLDSGVPADVLARASWEMVRGAATAQVENRTESWTFATYRDMNVGAAGRQYASFLQVLWAGTPLAEHAEAVGLELGTISRVAQDIVQQKHRFLLLSKADQKRALAWARALLERVRKRPLGCVQLVVASIGPRLADPA